MALAPIKTVSLTVGELIAELAACNPSRLVHVWTMYEPVTTPGVSVDPDSGRVSIRINDYDEEG